MDVKLATWTKEEGWTWPEGAPADVAASDWILYFGSRSALAETGIHAHWKAQAPKAVIMGCSTGGEIIGPEVLDNVIVTSVIRFKSTRIKPYAVDVSADHTEMGRQIAKALSGDGLRHIFVLSDGMMVNGTDLVSGIFEGLGNSSVTVTGGLAGDGADFKTTSVGLGAEPTPGKVVAVGLYGNDLTIGYGSMGGWDTFGPERAITRAEGNMLYELDGHSAIDLYRSYLADNFGKPGGALMFPLAVRPPGAPESSAIVRTVMGIDEENKRMTFAGDIPQGHIARLMRGNFDHLVDGASGAATLASESPDGTKWGLALLVSCIGRKLLLGQRISDESEAVAETLNSVPTIGFYSYGEICHHAFTKECNLHNQTMTITLLGEK